VETPSRSAQILRPLGNGELLDRAVTLCVRHFVLFALIYLVYAIPFALVQFYASHDLARTIESLSTVLQAQTHGGKTPSVDQILKGLSQGPRTNGWAALTVVLSFLVAPLPVAALISATTTSYLGGTAGFGQAYRVALARWPALVGLNVLYLACGGAVYLVSVVFLIVVVIALTFVTVQVRAVGIALDVVVGGMFLIAALGFGIAAALAIQVSYFTCVVERAPCITAFARGLGRVFARVGLQRALVVGVALVAIGIGIFMVSLVGQSIILGIVHSEILGTAYATLLRVATAAFTTAFVAIFYYDLRVREEGLDLQLAAQATAPYAPPVT
jgi:hypothetical protein